MADTPQTEIEQKKEELQNKKPSKLVLKDIAEVFFQEREYDFNRLEKSFKDQTQKLAQLGIIMRNQAISFRNVEKIINSQFKFNEKIHREDYQIEQRNDKQFALMHEQNNILKQILNKLGGRYRKKRDEEEYDMDFDGGDVVAAGLAGALIPKILKNVWRIFTWPFRSLGKSLGKTIGKMLVWPVEKIFGKEIVKKLGLKAAGKFVGKLLAWPIALLFSGLDFYNGFKDAEKITKRKGLAGKFQAGFSSMLSGLTLSIISPQIISNAIDTIGEKFTSTIKAIPNRVHGWVTELRKIPPLDKAFAYIISKFETLRNIVTAVFNYFSEKFEEFGSAMEEESLRAIRGQYKYDEKKRAQRKGYLGGYDLTGKSLMYYIPGKTTSFVDSFKQAKYFRPSYIEVQDESGKVEPVIQFGDGSWIEGAENIKRLFPKAKKITDIPSMFPHITSKKHAEEQRRLNLTDNINNFNQINNRISPTIDMRTMTDDFIHLSLSLMFG